MAEIIIRDDEGDLKVVDFYPILTRQELSGPGDKAHQVIIDGLKGVPVGQLRSDILTDLEQELLKQWVLGMLFPCAGCGQLLLENKMASGDDQDPTCKKCMTDDMKQAQADPDHLNLAKGGNQAADDYW
jgi:hypothetical protein